MAQDFAGALLSSPLAKADAREGMCNLRLVYASATTLSVVVVDGDYTAQPGQSGGGNYIAAKGLSPILNTTDHVLSSTATDSGSGMAASTMYAIYWCFAGALSGGLGASATMPSLNSSNVLVLGASGDAASCLFIGYAYTNGSTQFADDDANRLVLSYYNRRRKRILLKPGYSDNNAQNSLAVFSSSWTRINAGTGDTALWIDAYGQQVHGAACFTTHGATTAAAAVGVGDSGATRIDFACGIGNAALAGDGYAVPFVYDGAATVVTTAPTLNSVAMVARSGAGTLNLRTDEARNGATTDPLLTFLAGSVWT